MTEVVDAEAVEDMLRLCKVLKDVEDDKKQYFDDWRERVDLLHLNDTSMRKRVMDLREKYRTVFVGKLG